MKTLLIAGAQVVVGILSLVFLVIERSDAMPASMALSGPKCRTHLVVDFTIVPTTYTVVCVMTATCTPGCGVTSLNTPAGTTSYCTCGGGLSECCNLKVVATTGGGGVAWEAVGKCSATDANCQNGDSCKDTREVIGSPSDPDTIDVWAICLTEE